MKNLEEDKESEELKQCLEIIPDDGDDVTIDAIPLSTKSPTVVGYKIYKEGKKSYFQIIRADGKTQMYLTFGKMLKNFDKEDLEVLWSIVKARFKKTEPVNYMDNFLLLNLKTIFEHHVKDNVWKNQQGLVQVLNWKLYDSCGVHCVTMQNMIFYLLVEKMYPLTNHTLYQMFNDVKLQIDYECEMAFEHLRLVKKQLKEGTTDSELDARVTALEKKFSDFELKSKALDNMTQNLGSRVFTLELQELPQKINQTVNEVVKEAIHVAFQAPLQDRFREMPKADMKEILHQRMFESDTYKPLPEHVALYKALEASMERANRDEFLAEKDKSQKRRCDDQDPPPPPPNSDLSKKKRHDSEAPSSSSKKKYVPHSKQPVEDVPIPDDMNISDSEDTDTAHLPKIKTRPNWLKPVPEEDKPASLEPDYTGDMSSFINWFYKRFGKKKLSKAALEGPDFKVVRPFHDNTISLQFQMEECHLMLTDQIDLVNPEGHRVVPDVSKPLPLGGPPGQVTIQTQYFFNKELKY
ncbi:hypothetical protein Tco_1283417 [Tanacetum coccineum]